MSDAGEERLAELEQLAARGLSDTGDQPMTDEKLQNS
jgi:hypothetical protein